MAHRPITAKRKPQKLFFYGRDVTRKISRNERLVFLFRSAAIDDIVKKS